MVKVLFFLALAALTGAEFVEETLLYDKFPDDFIWAAATAAYQIEGAWNVDGKVESIWDVRVHAGNVEGGATGDDACKSYEFYNKDIDALKFLGVSHYRFSIAWTRVMSDAAGTPNPFGIQYYKNLIAALKAANIEPMVTLYHWDLPQSLQEMGGFLNASLADWFEQYADLCFREFGADVKYWITFNEPYVVAYLGYGIGIHAPGISDTGKSDYIVTHNLLRAHAKAYRLYESKYKPTQQGSVGITLSTSWEEPENDDPENVAASRRHLDFLFGWFANPIFDNGDYPQTMIDKIGNKSQAQGFPESRLPKFTEEEKMMLKGSADFLGLNYYTAAYVRNKIQDINWISFDADKDIEGYQDGSWYGSASSWLRIAPWGLRKLLNYIKERYNDPKIIITENGYSDKAGYLDDSMRIYYYKYNINNVLKAIKDGVNVQGYTAWSLMDNFEWGRGYSERFGLHYIDFNDPDRPRVPKDSAKYYASLVRKNEFTPEDFECEL